MSIRSTVGAILLGATLASFCAARALEGPNPAAPKETAQFAFLVGDWDCTIRRMLPDGSLGAPTGASWTGKFILDGWAIQDYWVSTNAAGGTSHGTNIRSFNPKTGQWDNRWLASGDLQWLYFSAQRIGETMVMTGGERTDASGRSYLVRNTFHDISADSFKWRQERSLDGGSTWLNGVAIIECDVV